MPLSSVIGSSSIMQPGVCTSSTRPASPYDGQVIYETDTDKIAVYDSSAWVYKTGTSAPTAPGLVYITQATPTAVQSISINDCFSATYANYLILANFTASVGANGALTMRLRSSGVDATTNYNQVQINSTSEGVINSTGYLSQTSFAFGQIDPTYNVLSSQLNVFNPFATDKTLAMGTYQVRLSTGRYDQRITSEYHSDATSYDGFTIITSGTSVTGIIRVYGYANS
jgi:hypothetical protein